MQSITFGANIRLLKHDAAGPGRYLPVSKREWQTLLDEHPEIPEKLTATEAGDDAFFVQVKDPDKQLGEARVVLPGGRHIPGFFVNMGDQFRLLTGDDWDSKKPTFEQLQDFVEQGALRRMPEFRRHLREMLLRGDKPSAD